MESYPKMLILWIGLQLLSSILCFPPFQFSWIICSFRLIFFHTLLHEITPRQNTITLLFQHIMPVAMLSKLLSFAIGFCLPAIVVSQNITDSLVAHYSFCDCTATDISGNGRHGTIAGSPQCINGNRGKGLLLNQNGAIDPNCGTPGGEHVKLPALNAIWEKGITICAWVKFDFENFYERIVDFSNGTIGDLDGVVLWFGRENVSNDLAIESWISEDFTQARTTGKLLAPNAIVNGVLQHYAVTIQGDTMRLYVNGTMVAEKKGNPVRNVPRSSNYIGKSTWCGFDPDLKGFIDEVRIYNRGLSPAEIMMVYNDAEVIDFDALISCSAKGTFTIPASKAADSVRWNFGDPASGIENTSPGNNVTHQFTAPGIYSIQAIVYKYCRNDTITRQITVDVTPVLAASIIADRNNICTGEEMAFTASTNATSPSYQWQVNGINAGADNPEFSSSELRTGDKVSCIITTGGTCGGSVTSNIITINVVAAVSPDILIDGTNVGICVGAEVNFTATPFNGGSAPVFQWQVNGINVGSNSINFSSTALNPGDSIRCILTSNATCVDQSMDTSNILTMQMLTPVTPFIEITTTASTACENEPVLFNAAIEHGGTTPGYEWMINGIPAGSAATFSSSVFRNGDVVSCMLTSDLACTTQQTDTSETITVTINETVRPALTVTASSNNICAGSPLTFTAIPENEGSSPAYQWEINGVTATETSNIFTGNNFNDGDVIRCTVISSSSCAVPNTATAEETVTISENIGSITEKVICDGETFWGYDLPGTYVDQFVSANGCDSIRTLHLEVRLKSMPFLGNDTAICSGETLLLTPGLFDSYLWNNGSTQGSLTISIPGVYRVTVTSDCGTATDDIIIAEKICDSDIWFPSSFSPNGDNLNDRFGILNAGHLESYYLSVYNRWGEKIFETTSPSDKWDGRTKGVESPTGIYTWYSVINKGGTVYKKKGHVSIIR